VSATASRLRRALDVEDLVATAQALIRCRSVNPPGDERAAAAAVVAELEKLGAHAVDTVEAAEGRPSIVARWGTPGGRVLAWNGHTDVVPAGDEAAWRYPPFEGRVADGRVWGRGAVDMKGPIAALCQALAMLRQADVPVAGEVLITIAADEETGGRDGSGHLAERGLLGPADAGICGEPSSLDTLVAARGRLWVEIVAKGTSAHASQPQAGRNAVAAILRVAEQLEAIELPGRPHPLVGAATLTPTMIVGGDSPNSVPDRCVLTIDRRFLPGEPVADVRRQIADAVGRAARASDVEIDVIERACFDASEIEADSDIVAVAGDATEAAIGRRPAIGGMPGSTDARFLIAAGIPTVIFGPGDVREAHTVDESIAIDEMADGALAYAATIARFLGGA
jgi:succinyl-diaminopimelate desuccinylase